MKNHFIISYAGNKREEIDDIFSIIDLDKLNNITTIVEPFCGTCAFSYYISQKYPNKFKYILNDNSTRLIDILEIMKDGERYNKFKDKVNEAIRTLDNKDKYLDIITSKTTLGWFIANKFFNIRPGLYPTNKSLKEIKDHYPIMDFLRTENIEIHNKNAMEIIQKYKDDESVLIFMDPPYLQTCNDFYDNTECNIYEYLFENSPIKMKSYIVFSLEYIWINKLLFKECIDKCKTLIKDKTYQPNKKKTTHFYFSNTLIL